MSPHDETLPWHRPRRNRRTAAIRGLVRETRLHVEHLIAPVFIKEGIASPEEIETMPGVFRHTTASMLDYIGELVEAGVSSVVLFPSINEGAKDPEGMASLIPDGLYLSALKEIKRHYPDVCLMTDVALDPYSSDGHDGLVRDGQILNDETLPLLAAMAVAQADAGADLIGPSDMMDGRVAAIRQALDKAGHTGVGILSYTAKYASAFYGPFRDALGSAPKSGDKKTYQMDIANRREALREAQLDEAEGADILMVKPALPYLDIISDLRDASLLPIAAYQVSGEYAMIKMAARAGCLNEEAAILESLTAIHRAGAQMILTYFALPAARALASS